MKSTTNTYEFYHYLPVSDTVMKWGLYLTGCGLAVIPSKEHYPPIGHPTLYSFDYERGRILPEFQIILVTEGKGTFESRPTGQVDIQPNTVMMLFPDVWHRYMPNEETGWTERWISINGSIAHYLMEQGYINPDNAVCSLRDPEHLLAHFNSFLDHIHKEPTVNTLLTSMRTIAFINEVIESTENTPPATETTASQTRAIGDDPLVASALDLIWTHSHRPISVNDLQSQLPTTRRTLERRFRECCGHTIHEEIIQCRLSRAKRLISETHLPIKTIAYLSGFSHPERMRTAFEKHEGKPPSKFRR